MDTRELPVLTGDDENLTERLAVGLGDDVARVLAYLLLRKGMEGVVDEPATRLAVRVGTSLNRDAAATALNHLEDRALVTTTTVRDGRRGRPPKAWVASEPIETTVRRVFEHHAEALLREAKTVATALGADVAGKSETHSTAVGRGVDAFRLGLNWRPNVLHAPFFLAAADGYYETHDIDVTLSHHRGSGRALDGLLSGTTDVALAGAATMVRRRETGESVLPVALLFQRAMAVLYTTREAFGGRFESIEQLRDRRVGMSSTSETGLLGRLFLSQAGILDDVTVVDIAGEERAALRSGRADVVMGSFADPHELRTDDHAIDSLLVADRFPLYGPALVTTERTLCERPVALERFLAGTMAGWAAAVEHPAAAVHAVTRDEPADGSTTERERRTFERAVAEFAVGNAVDTHGWGWQRVDGWERLATALDQAGLVGRVS